MDLNSYNPYRYYQPLYTSTYPKFLNYSYNYNYPYSRDLDYHNPLNSYNLSNLNYQYRNYYNTSPLEKYLLDDTYPRLFKYNQYSYYKPHLYRNQRANSPIVAPALFPPIENNRKLNEIKKSELSKLNSKPRPITFPKTVENLNTFDKFELDLAQLETSNKNENIETIDENLKSNRNNYYDINNTTTTNDNYNNNNNNNNSNKNSNNLDENTNPTNDPQYFVNNDGRLTEMKLADPLKKSNVHDYLYSLAKQDENIGYVEKFKDDKRLEKKYRRKYGQEVKNYKRFKENAGLGFDFLDPTRIAETNFQKIEKVNKRNKYANYVRERNLQLTNRKNNYNPESYLNTYSLPNLQKSTRHAPSRFSNEN